MPWRVLVRRRGRVVALGWGVADQALSSLTNMALSLSLARALGPRAFGTFTLAFATYLVALGASRAINTEPLVIRFTGAPPGSWKDATRSATGSAVLIGLVAGLVCGIVGSVTGGPTGAMLVAFGLSLPGLLAQDAWRFAFLASGREARAFANDLSWAVFLLPLIVALSISGTVSAARYTLAWGTAATGAAIVGAVQARVLPRISGSRGWWKDNRDLAPGFLGQYAMLSGARHLMMFSIAGVAGMEVVGSLRAAEILMGPLNVLSWGISLAAVPEGVRLLRRSSAELLRWCFLLSTLLTAAGLSWGVAVYLLPSTLGHALLKGTWEGAAPLILPLALGWALSALRAGPEIGLRALGAANRGLRAQCVGGGMRFAAGTTGAALAGAGGAAWALALAVPVVVAWWWWDFSRSLPAHQAQERPTFSMLRTGPGQLEPGGAASVSHVVNPSRIELGTSGGQP